eukprot:gene15805-21927_t
MLTRMAHREQSQQTLRWRSTARACVAARNLRESHSSIKLASKTLFFVLPGRQQGQARDCKLRRSTDLAVTLSDQMMSLSIFLLALIHCLVQGIEGKQLSVEAKLDWKHVLSLPSEGPAYHDWKLKTQELVRGRPFNSYDRHIPVLGVGLNNDPFSLLLRLFYSIDYPVDTIVLLTGSSIDEHVQRELDHITRHFKNVVVRQGHDTWLGVSESWNAIMMEVSDAPWVFIVSLDIEFAPGSLQRLAHRAWEDWDKNLLDQAVIEYCNDGMSGGYSAFVMSRSIISKLGLFDENIFPAYYEDTEYEIRMRKYEESTGLYIHRYLYGDVVALHGLPTEEGGMDHRGVINAMSKQVSAVPKERIFEAANIFIRPYLTKKSHGSKVSQGTPFR